MENFKWLDKWYSRHVIENHKENISLEIKTKSDMGWILKVDFTDAGYKHLKLMTESKKVSDYNYYTVEAQDKQFYGDGDFTKLDFLISKFRAFIGETDIHAHENDFFLNPDIQSFIFEEEKDSMIFLHYTSEEEVAQNIINTGFEFCVAFDKTTTSMFNDPIDINYNHLIRKPFGKFVVVICISKDIYKKYSKLVSKSGNRYLKVEEILSEKPVYKNELSEDVYTLNRKFIKGFLNYTTGKIIANKEFNSKFDSDQFLKNLK